MDRRTDWGPRRQSGWASEGPAALRPLHIGWSTSKVNCIGTSDQDLNKGKPRFGSDNLTISRRDFSAGNFWLPWVFTQNAPAPKIVTHNVLISKGLVVEGTPTYPGVQAHFDRVIPRFPL